MIVQEKDILRKKLELIMAQRPMSKNTLALRLQVSFPTLLRVLNGNNVCQWSAKTTEKIKDFIEHYEGKYGILK